MNTYDHYEEAEKLASQLEAEGFSREAAQIRSAMTEGKTGTEIFMILRFRLKPLLEIVRLSEPAKQRLQLLYSRLDEALQ